MFVTEHIEKTLRRQAVFNCGNEQILFWGSPRTSDVEEIAERLKFVTAHVIDRAEAEFEHLAPFSCFHVPTLRDAFCCADPAEARKLQQTLQCYIRKIATLLKVDALAAAREYRDASLKIVELTGPESRWRPQRTTKFGRQC